jgi:ABC-type arginine transport system permease subunit
MNYHHLSHLTWQDFESNHIIMTAVTIIFRSAPYLILIATMFGVLCIRIETSKRSLHLYRLSGKKEISIDDIDSYTAQPFIFVKHRTKVIRCVLMSVKNGKTITLESYNLYSLKKLIGYFDEP